MRKSRGDVRYHVPRERSPVPALLVGVLVVTTLVAAQVWLVADPGGIGRGEVGPAGTAVAARAASVDGVSATPDGPDLSSGLPVAVELTFDVGSDAPAGDADAVLGPVLDALRVDPSRRVRVVGHAERSNDAVLEEQLSLRRAETVVGLLVARGVPRERADVNAAGATQVGRSLSGTDRRVTVEVVG